MRLSCYVGIRADRAPTIYGQLPGVAVVLHAVDAGVYNVHVTRAAGDLDLQMRLASPASAPGTALGLAAYPSAAPDNRWRVWQVMPVESISRHVGLRIYRALHRAARLPDNTTAQGEHHVTRPWTRGVAEILWAPAAFNQLPPLCIWYGDPTPEAQALWGQSYDPDDANCDADVDSESEADAVFGGA